MKNIINLISIVFVLGTVQANAQQIGAFSPNNQCHIADTRLKSTSDIACLESEGDGIFNCSNIAFNNTLTSEPTCTIEDKPWDLKFHETLSSTNKYLGSWLRYFVFDMLKSTSTDSSADNSELTPCLPGQEPLHIICENTIPYAQMGLAAYAYYANDFAAYKNAIAENFPLTIRPFFVEDKENPNKARMLQVKTCGLRARVFLNEQENEVVLALAGMEWRFWDTRNLPTFLKNANTAFWHILEYDMQDHFEFSLFFATELRNHYPEAKLTIVGSSLGGSIAQYIALNLNTKAYCFNSLGVNTTIDDKLSIKDPALYEKQNNLITHINLSRDIIADILPEDIVGKQLGRTYTIPCPDDSIFERHNMEAVVKDLGDCINNKLE